jgi:hypothetical protein
MQPRRLRQKRQLSQKENNMKEASSQKATPGFDAATGTSSEGFSRGPNKYAKNQHTGHSNDGREVNFGRGPTVGNKSTKSTPGTDSMPALQCGKDMFTGKPQVRTPGGTRAFEPKAGQNYKGDPNSINVGRGPTKGNQL